ncbi:MAG TPA: hypothetical protein VHL08_10730 [Dongiaceae bacterium]|jgi:flagellar basal-body rod protein FlgB|nr:hypothetical protein [Dongiaceae bacterium]
MNMDQIPLIAALRQRLNWLVARENVLSQNIANADTPHYAARDVKEIDFSALLDRVLDPARTAAGHLGGIHADGGITSRKDQTYEVAPSGNSVILEEQMTKLSTTQSRYDLLIGIYRKQLEMMRTAFGRGG